MQITGSVPESHKDVFRDLFMRYLPVVGRLELIFEVILDTAIDHPRLLVHIHSRAVGRHYILCKVYDTRVDGPWE